MAVYPQRAARTAPLVQAAQAAGLPFEASPTGRWIRLAGRNGVVYLVQDAWSDGCLLLHVSGEEEGRSEHFLRTEPAVMAAARCVGLSAAGLRADRAVPFAEAS